ncbi:MAG: ABC-type Fe3+ transport system periplasmic component, partial [Chloroflexi bacterium]|nr:ABC-type Fe3+ transport system periplasmic component [Chloroflexota bacterium]
MFTASGFLSRSRWSLLATTTLLLVIAALMGCGAPTAALPPAAGSGASEWDEVLAAARREGTISVTGPPGADTREAFTEAFERKYPGITVDYASQPGSAVAPKLIAERGSGQYLLDVIINGTTTQLALARDEILDPIDRYLVGPEAAQSAKWFGGKFEFSDNAGKYNLVFGHVVKSPLAYDPKVVSPGEIKSYNDLLNPKWKGKIAMYDPRGAGAGFATTTFLYTYPALGKDYLRQLFSQDIAFSRDDRQLIDWIARGQYAIAIAPSERMYTEFSSRGIEVGMMGAEDLAEGSYLTAGVAAVGVINNPPHPNATKVYLDYLLSREAQLEFSQATGYVSRRTDVPTDHLPGYVIPKQG